MREAHFIDKNKAKWSEIEYNLKNKINVHPDTLAKNYIEITNDLAFAQTYYSKSKTKDYLNELALFAHQSIYKDQRSSTNQLIEFFKNDVPNTVYQNHRMFLYAFLIFSFAVLIGILSSHFDADFTRLIMGNDYVEQTLVNIKKGDPAAIYKSGSQTGTTLAITINNIKVAFYAFAMGLLFSVGSGYILFSNGVMLGAFHYIFFKEGVLGKAMTAIWMHGTIEISVIIIAGACGLMLGNGFLFPKTLSRRKSLVKKAKEAVMILLSTVPLFMIAGFIEGFVTRLYDVNLYFSLAVIFLSLILIVWYYIIYPIRKNRVSSFSFHQTYTTNETT
ncbi:stage II sporulation protein M [Chishuiella changwenlii]|uniref:stage II sporulation protein M n=1 Tax=Chishuiella changwenlii TaxID=1434701 RepID=UPI002FDB4AA5